MNWFIVLSQASMKLFTRKNARAPLKHMKSLENELVGLKGQELTRHKPGVASQGDAADGRTVLNGNIDPRDLVVQDFARKMADYLDEQRKKDQFRELHIAAEPRMMGLLRKSLSQETKKLVREWVNKDLGKADVQRLAQAFA